MTLKTPSDVANFLNGSSPQSQAAKARVIAAYKATGATAYVTQALNGSAYVPFQMKVAAEILGTSYFQNGQVYVEATGQWRSVGPYDVIWIPVTPDGKLIKGAAVRADCGNPHLTKVIPVIPGENASSPTSLVRANVGNLSTGDSFVSMSGCPTASNHDDSALQLCGKSPRSQLSSRSWLFPPTTVPGSPHVANTPPTVPPVTPVPLSQPHRFPQQGLLQVRQWDYPAVLAVRHYRHVRGWSASRHRSERHHNRGSYHKWNRCKRHK